MSSISPLDPGHPVENDLGSQDDNDSSWVDREIPPMIQRSQEAFRRDLPELLKKHEGKWVAYSGDRRLGMGRSKSKLARIGITRLAVGEPAPDHRLSAAIGHVEDNPPSVVLLTQAGPPMRNSIDRFPCDLCPP
jgi:hypothetical protein